MSDTISRQAAISHVDDVPYIKDHPNVGLLWKAWIESLPSAQPEKRTQEPCEDAIRRADAEALFRNARRKLNPSDYKTADEFNTRDLMLLNAEQFIHLLPSVRPQEPKTGHWIKVTNGRGGHECDLCHEYAPSYQSGKEYLTNYCPNCGAKMIEPQESEKTE